MSKSKCINKEDELKVILEELVCEANEVTQFSQRKARLRAGYFVQAVVLGWFKKGDASLNELAQTAFKIEYAMTGQQSTTHDILLVTTVSRGKRRYQR